MHTTAKKWKKFIWENKFLSVFIGAQILILGVLVLKSMAPPVKVQMGPEQFQIIENLGVHILEDGGVGTVIADENEHDGYEILKLPVTGLGSGAYQVTVQYQANKSMANPSHSATTETGRMCFNSENNPLAFKASEIIFDDGHDVATGRMWMRVSSHINQVTGTVFFDGNGQLEIYSVTIAENVVWRITRFLGYLFTFALLDIFLFFMFYDKKERSVSKMTLLCIGGIVILSSLPLFSDSLFFVKDQDLKFHLTRIWWIADALKNGQFPVRMDTGVLNGAGYAGSLFYGELLLYIPGILYNMMVPLQDCYIIYAVMINFATCVISYYSFKKIGRDHKIGLAAAVIYTLSPYRLGNLYVRAAVGEYTAMAFLPLVILGFYQVYDREDTHKFSVREYLPIIVGLTGLIQSHMLTCEMTGLFIMMLCVILFKKTFMPQRFMALAKAAVLTVLVNIWFLLPFLESMHMHVGITEKGGVSEIQKFGTYLAQIFTGFYPGIGATSSGMQGDMPLAVGFSLTIVFGLYVYCCSRRQEWRLSEDKMYRQSMVCFFLSIIALLLSSVYFPWDSLVYINEEFAHMMCTIQFPWRYVAIITVLLVLLTVFTLDILKKHRGEEFTRIVITTLFLGALLSESFFEYQFTNSALEKKFYTIEEIGNGNVMGEEYLPSGTETYEVSIREVKKSSEEIQIQKWNTEKGIHTLQIANESGEEGRIVLPVINYDHYEARDLESKDKLVIENSSNNTIQIVLPKGYEGTIRVAFREPVYWRIYELISLITIIGVIYLSFGRGKQQHPDRVSEV